MNRTSAWLVIAGCALVALVLVALGPSARAETWRQPKQNVEWAFKFGAISVALEKCTFEKGKRFGELEANAKEAPSDGDKRTEKEGREFMMILDGPDPRVLCGTALKFFGPDGRDLPNTLKMKDAAATE